MKRPSLFENCRDSVASFRTYKCDQKRKHDGENYAALAVLFDHHVIAIGNQASPNSFSNFARSNPTTASPSIRVTGVARKPNLINSSSAFLSARISFATNCTPLRERNSFSWSQLPHPGCVYTTTCFAMASSVSAYVGQTPPLRRLLPEMASRNHRMRVVSCLIIPVRYSFSTDRWAVPLWRIEQPLGHDPISLSPCVTRT